MDSLDNNYTSGGMISDHQKTLFRNSATWMKTFSIVIFVLLGIIVLVFGVVFLAMGDKLEAEIMKELGKKSKEGKVFFNEIWPTIKMMIYIGLLMCVAYIFAAVQLLKTANRFTAISYSDNSEDIKVAFATYKKFWMIMGIMMITAIVLAIALIIKLVPIAMELQQMKGK